MVCDLTHAVTLAAKFARLTSEQSQIEGDKREGCKVKANKNIRGTAGFNFSELLARVENDRGLLRELVTIFKDEFPRHLTDLREAVARQDAPRVANASHA